MDNELSTPPHDNFEFTKEYKFEEYPIYDNYAAIECNRKTNIPKNYFGLIGVPITFLDDYNPDQFEIIGVFNSGNTNWDYIIPKLCGIKTYKRIAIRLKNPNISYK